MKLSHLVIFEQKIIENVQTQTEDNNHVGDLEQGESCNQQVFSIFTVVFMPRIGVRVSRSFLKMAKVSCFS